MKFKIGDKVIEMIEDDGLSKKDIVKSVFDALKENAHKVKKSEEEEPYVEIVYNVHAMSEDGTAYGTVGVLNEDGDMEACRWDYKDGEFEFSRKKGEVSEEILKRREEIESKLIDAIADKSTDEAEAKAMGFAHDAECKDDGERMEEEEFKKYKGLTRVMFNDLLEAAKKNTKIDNAVDLLEDYISTLPFVPIDTDSDVTIVYVDKDNGILIIDGDDDSALDEIVEDSKKKSVKDVKLISDITDYVPWSGARETWDKIVAAKKVNELDAILEDIYPEGLSMTELNDLLWFDDEDVLNWLGISEEVEDSCKKDACKKDAVKDYWMNRETGEVVSIDEIKENYDYSEWDDTSAISIYEEWKHIGKYDFDDAKKMKPVQSIENDEWDDIVWVNNHLNSIVRGDDDPGYDEYDLEHKSAPRFKRYQKKARDAKSKKICDICGQEVKDIEKIGQHFSVCPECKRHMKESDIELLK